MTVLSPYDRLNARRPHLAPLTEKDLRIFDRVRAFFPIQLEEGKETIQYDSSFKLVGRVKVLNNKGIGTLFDIRAVPHPHHQNDWICLPYSIDSYAFISQSNSGWLYISRHIDSLYINKISSFYLPKLRLGTTLIQLAIELSQAMGYEGKVSLKSVNGSSLFYYKLGFKCVDPTSQEELQKATSRKEAPDVVDMVLTDSALQWWKEKIDENPIIPDKTSFSLTSCNWQKVALISLLIITSLSCLLIGCCVLV